MKSLFLITIISLSLTLEICKKLYKTNNVNKEYETVVAIAAPDIPNFGISIIFKGMLTINAISDPFVPIMGNPTPVR